MSSAIFTRTQKRDVCKPCAKHENEAKSSIQPFDWLKTYVPKRHHQTTLPYMENDPIWIDGYEKAHSPDWLKLDLILLY